eukprot:GHVO01046646.1.p1 GENE.GHVO01046646.1~~GHVO01046646.1.p1  ORF type:complete len:163 (-),score=13.58 GHVO01046646.1:288-776(-)
MDAIKSLPSHRSLRALARGLKKDKTLKIMEQGIPCRFYAVLSKEVHIANAKVLISDGKLCILSRGGSRPIPITSRHRVKMGPTNSGAPCHTFILRDEVKWTNEADKAGLTRTVILIRPPSKIDEGIVREWPYVFAFNNDVDRRTFASGVSLLLTYFDVYMPA